MTPECPGKTTGTKQLVGVMQNPLMSAKNDQKTHEKHRRLPESIRRRNITFLDHLGLVHLVAQRQLQKSTDSYDDLVQESALGALAAVERFDEERGCRPSTYIVSRANGQILHYRRDRSSIIKVPWRHRDLAIKAERLQKQQTVRGLPALSEAELAMHLGVGLEKLQACCRGVQNCKTLSLDQPQHRGNHEVDDPLMGCIKTGDQSHDDEHAWLISALKKLDPFAQHWLLAHYVDGCSLRDLAGHCGMNTGQMRILLRDAVQLLKAWAKRDGVLKPMPLPGVPRKGSESHSPLHC